MAFVYIRAAQHRDLPGAGFDSVGSVFGHYDAYLKAGSVARGFVVNARDADERAAVVTQIRADKQHCLKPVFVVNGTSSEDDYLSDGAVGSVDELHKRAQVINDLAANLQGADIPEHKEDRLLRYLYMRPDKVLEPVCAWHHREIYHYPIVEALAHEPTGQAQWLASLVQRQLLEPVDLRDRIRLCADCNDAHVSFIDVCSSCGHIEIEQESFLHCYTCGFVAPQNDFISATGLQCGKCHVQLRHIGVDYDRTLDNFVCHACQHIFPEPDIKSRCHICGWRGDADDLLLRRIETLRLTEAGRLYARRDNIADVLSVLDGLNYANPGYFAYMADWFIKLSRRYPDTPFGLLVVSLSNVIELTESIGRNQVMLMLDGLGERLRELIRTTDIATRTSDSMFWLLLPHTPASGCEVVAQRVKEFQAQTRQIGGAELQIATAFVVGPDNIAASEDAALVMARLRSQVSGDGHLH